MRSVFLSILLLTGTVLAGSHGTKPNIDPERVTVSGISSGAHMAHQLHLAYSELFSGAGIVSGGPYFCADNSLLTAMGRCMDNTDEPLPVDELVAVIREQAAAGNLADTNNLADDRVWLFHGSKDVTIARLVHDATADVYAAFVPPENLVEVNDIPAGHFLAADGRGHGCDEMKPPFVGDCGYDTAGTLLGYLYPGLVDPATEVSTELQEVTLPGADNAELLETAYLFVPAACASGEQACGLHLVLHGCAQSAEVVGTAFIEQSGYLQWAESNGIVLAFPQVEKSMVAPMNPHGCWDWWGYTGDEYAYRDGEQMKVLADWIRSLSN
ncbi:MAG: polyhydroxybutyrate depolymerase [Gammaproteobacteria bacterium]|nr:polyhydroxybutyrate depolymerase [Gammaproteobacteria bacterium]